MRTVDSTKDMKREEETHKLLYLSWARGKRSGCSPGAAACHSQHARVDTDSFPTNPFFLDICDISLGLWLM